MVAAKDGITYVNCAVVPRIRLESDRLAHNFVIVELKEGVVENVDCVWVARNEDTFEIVEESSWWECLEGEEHSAVL